VVGKIPSNLTLVATGSDQHNVLGRHTVLRPAATLPSRLALSIDVPSTATATGLALLLDGEGAGIVRASLMNEEPLSVAAWVSRSPLRLSAGLA
jgi:hypothetical protein